jgi:hypothetical protein
MMKGYKWFQTNDYGIENWKLKIKNYRLFLYGKLSNHSVGYPFVIAQLDKVYNTWQVEKKY